MLFKLLLLTIVFLPAKNAIPNIDDVHYVYKIEINHLYNKEDGFEYYDQIILWRKYSDEELFSKENTNGLALEACHYLRLHHFGSKTWKKMNLHVVDWKPLDKKVYRRKLNKRELEAAIAHWKQVHPTLPFPGHIGRWVGGPLVPSRCDKGYHIFFKKEDGGIRTIISKEYVETSTPYDPELIDRNIWPLNVRDKPLLGPKK